ncbi:MAG: metal-sulfur cluster assembly factor [Chloroflexi bacterium]|nr:metal-sulfur cluster assembly factor [Chloroflexota bacterium]
MLTEQQVLNALRDVEDPEFPTSIVDLGLVCGVEIAGGKVIVRVTFTSMGCPAMDWILEDIRTRLLREPGVSEVDAQASWELVWNKTRISEKGRDDLFGIGVVV